MGLYGEPSGSINMQKALLCLDFLHEMLYALRFCETGGIFGYIDTPDEKLTISFMCDLPSEFLFEIEAFAENFQKVMASGGFAVRIIQEDPSIRLVLREGGKRDE